MSDTKNKLGISHILHELKDYAFITLGVALYAMSVTVFMLPYGLTTGGVAGIGSIIYYATGIEIQVTYVGINICLLIAAIKVLGIKFCMKTIYAVGLMTFCLWFFQRIIEIPDATNPELSVLPHLIGEESFMACVLGAICCGIGLAFCFENNGSTGGTDIIAAIVNKYKPISLGSVIMACDVVIISSCYFVFHDWARVIYGFVMLFICSMTLDYCIRRQNQSVQLMIFSRNADAIADAIIKLNRGATMLNGEGWYTHTDRKVVMSIIRLREQSMVLRMVKNIDPYCFVSMSDARSVWGEGFDEMKVSDKGSGSDKRVLVLASNSSHKLAEVRAVLGEKYEIRSLADIGCYIDIPEEADTLQGNALLKARFVKRYYGFDCIADDSALECTALGGLPGIYSRNYAAISKEQMEHPKLLRMDELDDGVSQEMLNILKNHKPVVDKPSDRDPKANAEKLMRELEGKADRSAYVHTVVALITGEYEDASTWESHTFEGILPGTIAKRPSEGNEDSFLYDSVFIPEGFDKTYFELGFEIKSQISQRSLAISKLKAFLETSPKKK